MRGGIFPSFTALLITEESPHRHQFGRIEHGKRCWWSQIEGHSNPLPALHAELFCANFDFLLRKEMAVDVKVRGYDPLGGEMGRKKVTKE